ncbi:MAG: MBL fold metallo-hydrolase [Clostridiales bacterium]|jgi:glyoxylase-like metal-dependent hydrolase (beta-lactamase superfamily II)|nr:MBL fold metallo-hydrolase [Clostridiales bacterium]
MRVITTTHGSGKLSTKVFVSSEDGFNVTSTIVMGQKDCVLVDTQWTRANAHRVIAEIIETGLNLTTIFTTHAHPDHYWGMGEISKAFPEAKCLAVPPVITLYKHQYQAKLDEWIVKIGERNLCREECDKLEPLNEDYIMLEGERLEIIRCMGDLMWNTIVWIPSIKTVIGSDVIFNQAHPFTCEVNREQRALWIKDIDGIYDLKPDVVIPGHMREDCLFDESGLKFTRDYLVATEEELENTQTASEFFYNMIKRFPGATLNMLSNEMNAEVFKGGRHWEWNEDPDPAWLNFRTTWKD